MIQAFLIAFRQGFDAFLLVAMMYVGLTRTHNKALIPSIYWGVALSIGLSWILGIVVFNMANEALWEVIMGSVGVIVIGIFGLKAFRAAREEMDPSLEKQSENFTWTFLSAIIFSLVIISSEGMNLALLLIQIHSKDIIIGVLGGIGVAVMLAIAWADLGQRVSYKRFFQVTTFFCGLMILQSLFFIVHELTELHLIPNSEPFHEATEPFSSDGFYGKWFTYGIAAVCGLWLFFGREKPKVDA